MANPDLDIRYILPERIEEYTNNSIKDNGYDYLSDTELGLWLETDDSANNVEKIIQLIKIETFLENECMAYKVIFCQWRRLDDFTGKNKLASMVMDWSGCIARLRDEIL